MGAGEAERALRSVRVERVGLSKPKLLDGANDLLTQKFGIIPGRLRQLAGRDDTVVVVAHADSHVLGVTTGEVMGTHDKLHGRYQRTLQLVAPELVDVPLVIRDRAVVVDSARGAGLGSALSQAVLDWAIGDVGSRGQIGASLASEGGFGPIQRIVHRQGARWLGEVRNFWWSDDPELVPLLLCPDCDDQVCSETAYVYVNGPEHAPGQDFPVADLRTNEIVGVRQVRELIG